MEHDLEQSLSLLQRTPAALNALLSDLPETWTARNEGGQSWTISDVVAHLIHGERTDWLPRTKIVLQFGDTQTFEPFDMSVTFRRGGESRSRNCWTNLRAYV
jgi:hypothetical protein